MLTQPLCNLLRADLQNFAIFNDHGVLAQSHLSFECGPG